MRQRIRTIIRKEFRQVFRDPRMRGLLFIPPLIQLLIFGYAANLERLPALTAEHGPRFLCGIGPSGPQVIEGWHGVPYDRPLPRIRRNIR